MTEYIIDMIIMTLAGFTAGFSTVYILNIVRKKRELNENLNSSLILCEENKKLRSVIKDVYRLTQIGVTTRDNSWKLCQQIADSLEPFIKR